MTQAARHHRRAQHQQDVADDGAGDRCLDDVVQALAQGRQGDDQLRGVAEGRIEKSADALAHAFCQLLRGAPHPHRERQDGETCADEYGDVAFRGEVLQRNRDRYEHEQPVHVESASAGDGMMMGPAPSAAPVFPIDPFDIVRLEVGVDGCADRGEEAAIAESLEKAEALQLVLDRVLELGKEHLDAGRP